MADLKLYLVTLNEGRSNKNHPKFLLNVMDLRAKETDYGGINNSCIISHHVDARTLHMLCTQGFRKGTDSDVTVEEITKQSLNDPHGAHRLFTDIVDFFKRYNSYPNL